MRYIPYLKNQGLDISFCAQEKLHSLIRVSGIDLNPLTPKQTHHISEGKWIPLLSLPRYLQVNPNNPIISEPYIFSTNKLKKKWKNILSKEKRPIIGINWQGNPNAEKVYHIGRSLPLETFSSLARNNDIKFLYDLNQEEFSKYFKARPMKRTKRIGLKRNIDFLKY